MHNNEFLDLYYKIFNIKHTRDLWNYIISIIFIHKLLILIERKKIRGRYNTLLASKGARENYYIVHLTDISFIVDFSWRFNMGMNIKIKKKDKERQWTQLYDWLLDCCLVSMLTCMMCGKYINIKQKMCQWYNSPQEIIRHRKQKYYYAYCGFIYFLDTNFHE